MLSTIHFDNSKFSAATNETFSHKNEDNDATDNVPNGVGEWIPKCVEIWTHNKNRKWETPLHLMNDIKSLFHKINLFPSDAQIYEMIEFYGQNIAQDSKTIGIEFGQFCYCASLLERLRSKNIVIGPIEPIENAHDLFLGGSCNPTRWRFDEVIPQLESLQITYYNPQRDDWSPELVQIENQAKQNCKVLFFVIDEQTRAVASMVEVAYYSALKRKLILVVKPLMPWSEDYMIGDDRISKYEYKMLDKCRQFLKDIIEYRNIPVLNNIMSAVQSTATVLQTDCWPQELEVCADVTPVRNGNVSFKENLLELFNSFKSCSVSKVFTFAKLAFVYNMLAKRKIQPDMVKKLAKNHLLRKQLIQTDADAIPPLNIIKIKFDDFCAIVSELDLHYGQLDKEEEEQDDKNIYHLYIGGSYDQEMWEDKIKSHIKKQMLVSKSPLVDLERMLTNENRKIETSQHLLFIISADQYDLVTMIVAAHYIGRGKSVILCILPPSNSVDVQKVGSALAMKDFNRGRTYLLDIAKSHDVSVFDNIDDAINHTMEKF